MKRIAILAAALAAGPAAAQTTAELGTGLDYREGDYGTGERIETVTVDNALRVQKGRVTVSASVPYVRIEGPGNAVGGGGLLGLPIIIDPNRPPARTKREGVGDARIGAAYTVPAKSLGGVALTLSAGAKLPTASRRKGLGTGEADYSVGADVATQAGPIQPFAGIGYTKAGDPDGFELRDGISARAGAGIGISSAVRGQISYGYARSLSPLVPDEQQVTGAFDASLSKRLSVGVYGSAGLSNGSPDAAAGLGLRIRM